MKKAYKMNGKTYTTIMAMAKELGKARLYVKDFAKYGIVEITENIAYSVDTTKAEIEEVYDDGVYVDDDDDDEVVNTPSFTEDDDDDDDDDELVDEPVISYPKATKSTKVNKTDAELVEDLERDVVDLEVNEFGDRCRKISTEGLVKMATNVSVNTWDNIANIGIKRMRLIMSLKGAYYPDYKKSLNSGNTAAPTLWKKVSTEDLVAAATEKNAVYKDCENVGIKRMRLIMALKKVGVTAEDLLK